MTFATPGIEYRPPTPTRYRPPIGLIGCGGITESHLTAYRDMDLEVVALCDLDGEQAVTRRDQFYPDAAVYTDHEALLAREDVAVVDVATPPTVRPDIVADAIDAGKHVLSQKPFVLDLDEGHALVERAAEAGVRLAVNQNGRWAPHWRYCLAAAADGHLGTLQSATFAGNWNHDWIADTDFDGIDHAILYDYAIHWFDVIATLFADRDPRSVTATTTRGPAQTATPPLLAQAIVAYDDAQVSLAFDGHTRHGSVDRTVVAGTDGTVVSRGSSLNDQTVSVHRDGTEYVPDLTGQWFTDGFAGAMGELLVAIEDDRAPEHAARTNLASLELCFAAVAAAEDGTVVEPGEVRTLRGNAWTG